MKLIPLTQGKLAQVDDEDYDYLMQWKWFANKVGNTFYAKRNTPTIESKRNTIIMHRLILKSENDMLIDHIDGDGLNNVKSNLRVCTKSENNRNRKSVKGSTSKYLGVHFYTSKTNYTAWIAKIRHNKILYRLGYFKSENDAALAYNKKAQELHGEFANLNIITND